jgi:hypothetical protein
MSQAERAMFLLDSKEFHGIDPSKVLTFVAFWERYYRDPVSTSSQNKKAIDYFAELNLLGDLTVENVTRLLRWKDRRMLTHPKVAEGTATDNPRVVCVLNRLDTLNDFRRGDIDEASFAELALNVFPKGLIWPLFLFHLARPWAWPIADQHVFRSHAALFGFRIPLTLEGFQRYRASFANLAARLGPSTTDGADYSAVVASHKRLDNALMAYGQFLLKYDR